MRTAVTLVLLAVALATSAEAQQMQQIEIGSILNGGDVSPNRVLTGAAALAELKIDLAKREIAYEILGFNLPSAVRGAHVHVGSPGVVGPVLFDFRLAPQPAGDFTVRGTLSGADLTTRPELGIRDIVDALESVIAFATYIDIHTEGRGDGEIRGPLVLTSDSADSASARARRLLLQTLLLRGR